MDKFRTPLDGDNGLDDDHDDDDNDDAIPVD